MSVPTGLLQSSIMWLHIWLVIIAFSQDAVLGVGLVLDFQLERGSWRSRLLHCTSACIGAHPASVSSAFCIINCTGVNDLPSNSQAARRIGILFDLRFIGGRIESLVSFLDDLINECPCLPSLLLLIHTYSTCRPSIYHFLLRRLTTGGTKWRSFRCRCRPCSQQRPSLLFSTSFTASTGNSRLDARAALSSPGMAANPPILSPNGTRPASGGLPRAS